MCDSSCGEVLNGKMTYNLEHPNTIQCFSNSTQCNANAMNNNLGSRQSSLEADGQMNTGRSNLPNFEGNAIQPRSKIESGCC